MSLCPSIRDIVTNFSSACTQIHNLSNAASLAWFKAAPTCQNIMSSLQYDIACNHSVGTRSRMPEPWNSDEMSKVRNRATELG